MATRPVCAARRICVQSLESLPARGWFDVHCAGQSLLRLLDRGISVSHIAIPSLFPLSFVPTPPSIFHRVLLPVVSTPPSPPGRIAPSRRPAGAVCRDRKSVV